MQICWVEGASCAEVTASIMRRLHDVSRSCGSTNPLTTILCTLGLQSGAFSISRYQGLQASTKQPGNLPARACTPDHPGQLAAHQRRAGWQSLEAEPTRLAEGPADEPPSLSASRCRSQGSACPPPRASTCQGSGVRVYGVIDASERRLLAVKICLARQELPSSAESYQDRSRGPPALAVFMVVQA